MRSQLVARGGGFAYMPANPPPTGDLNEEEPTVTVYVSRNATTGQRSPELPACDSPLVPVGVADPPLLTDAWRRLFERQARKGDRR